jgi:hypothetical protein
MSARNSPSSVYPKARVAGGVNSLLSKIAGLSGSAAPLSGRASPFRAETALFLSSSPRRRLSLLRGEDEVGC